MNEFGNRWKNHSIGRINMNNFRFHLQSRTRNSGTIAPTFQSQIVVCTPWPPGPLKRLEVREQIVLFQISTLLPCPYSMRERTLFPDPKPSQRRFKEMAWISDMYPTQCKGVDWHVMTQKRLNRSGLSLLAGKLTKEACDWEILYPLPVTGQEVMFPNVQMWARGQSWPGVLLDAIQEGCL